MATQFSVRQTTDGVDIPEIVSGEYDEPGIEFDKPPEFTLTAPNRSGIEMYRLFAGKEVAIRRAGQLGIPGIIDTPAGSQGGGALSKVEAKGMHKGYKLLERLPCTDWSYGGGSTGTAVGRDVVVMNPWEQFIFRKPNGTVDVNGQTMAVDGITVDDSMRTLIGTKAIWQMDFQDNSVFLPTQISSASNAIQVYRDSVSGQTRPALQLVRNRDVFLNGSTPVESISWQQNNPDVSKMGDASMVEVLFIGKDAGDGSKLVCDVCRNANGARVYTNVPLTLTSNYNGTGLDAWSGVVDISADGASTRNSMGFRLSITPPPPVLLAVGRNGSMTSQDGSAWTGSTSLDFDDAAFSPSLGLIVAVGLSNIWSSSDANTWTSRLSSSTEWSGVSWSPDLAKFVAIEGSGDAYTSTDGITWTLHSTPFSASSTSFKVTWSPALSLFVMVPGQSRFQGGGLAFTAATSPDGVTWTAVTTSFVDDIFQNIAWSPALGLFVVVATASSGTDPSVLTSPDGVNWTGRVANTVGYFIGIAWSPALGMFVAVGMDSTRSHGKILTSTDGITWTSRTLATDTILSAVGWSPSLNLFVALADSGGGVMTSADGISWRSRTGVGTPHWKRVLETS